MEDFTDFSPSWQRLATLPHERTMWDFAAYYQRVHQLAPNVPEAVLEQWIHGLQGEYVTRRNYAWLDFDQLDFTLEPWPTERLLQVYAVESYRDCVQVRAACRSYKEFCCTRRDLAHWQKYGTWRVAPIVMDVASLGALPPEKELVAPDQLIEGHNRLGYLHAVATIALSSPIKLAATHLVWVLRQPHHADSTSN